MVVLMTKSKTHRMAGFPLAIAHVVGPSLAPLLRKAATTSFLPLPTAWSMGLSPLASAASTFASARSSSSATAAPQPAKAAWCSGVRLWSSPEVASAPRRRRKPTERGRDLMQDQERGVTPSASFSSNLAPLIREGKKKKHE